MLELDIKADNARELIEQFHHYIGGSIDEKWSETILTIDNEFAKGSIRYIPFDGGINLMDYDITFKKEIILKIREVDFIPIRFLFVEEGHFTHRFGIDKKEEKIDQYQTLIFTNKAGGYDYIHFPKNVKLAINVIQIIRKKFLQKRTTNASTLNSKLYEVFVDTDNDNRFMHHGTLNLKMANHLKKLRRIKSKGMLRV